MTGAERRAVETIASIKALMPPTQVPNLFTLGRVTTFVTQQPFQV